MPLSKMGVPYLGIFTAVFFLPPLVSSLRVDAVEIPKSTLLGSTTNVSCEYILDPNEYPAYLKLFKDRHMFFHLKFEEPPPQPNRTLLFEYQIYPAYGITIPLNNNSVTEDLTKITVTLIDIDFATGGTFDCEVGPYGGGRPGKRGENMTVISYPSFPPSISITGYPDRFEYGDILEGNCTFNQSYPEVELALYLNGEELVTDKTDIVRKFYPRMRMGNRYVVVKGLWLRATGLIIPPTPRKNVIECAATLYDRKWDAKKELRRIP